MHVRMPWNYTSRMMSAPVQYDGSEKKIKEPEGEEEAVGGAGWGNLWIDDSD